MLIPYNTDAPLYHFPLATLGLVAVNTLVFVATWQEPEQAAPWLLHFGDGLHPAQWITNAFLHADFLHLLGNMFFLWGFGLVVEGKLGWWKFLAVYLGIALVDGAIVQTAMLDSMGAALGASGVLFGLMAMALVWAPKNEMHCILAISPWSLAMGRYGGGSFDVPISVFAAIYLFLNFAFAYFQGFSMSSEMLHLTGAAIGAVVGLAFLKLDWVDCEGWDIFAVWSGKAGNLELPERKFEMPVTSKAPPEKQEPISSEKAEFITAALAKRIAERDGAGAARFYEKQRTEHPDWKLDEPALMGLVKLLHAQRQWSLAVRPMADYLRQYPERSLKMRLKLAEILIVAEKRPVKALKVLGRIDAESLPAELRAIFQKLSARAEGLLETADVELGDDEEW